MNIASLGGVLAAVRPHHGRFGLVLIVVLVVGALGFVLYRAEQRRDEARSRGQIERAPDRGAPRSPTAPPPGRAGAPQPASGATATVTAPPDGEVAPARGAISARTPTAAVASAAAPSARGEWAVETHGLTKRFGANVAVNDVELLVPRACAFGYLGPNGAGKTTLIRTLLGLTRADSGTMALLGVPVPAERARALARVGAIVDEPRFFGHLTGRENLAMLAAARGGAANARIAPALARVGLGGRGEMKVASYSMGMRQRLGVAACLLADPELLLLDEPMNGLDPAGIHEMREMIRGLVDEGRTVVLSSHLLDEVERTCDAVAIVDRGRVIRQGPIDELVRAGSVLVHCDCSDPDRAARLVAETGIAVSTSVADGVLSVTLPEGSPRALVAEVNRRLVEAGIEVYGLEEARASLEEWFLSVTSRLGDPS